jgi:hypothetical protein
MNGKILVAFIRPAILVLLVCVLEFFGRHLAVVY